MREFAPGRKNRVGLQSREIKAKKDAPEFVSQDTEIPVQIADAAFRVPEKRGEIPLEL